MQVAFSSRPSLTPTPQPPNAGTGRNPPRKPQRPGQRSIRVGRNSGGSFGPSTPQVVRPRHFGVDTHLISQGISVTFRNYTGRSPHHYRHACATHMLRNGCDIRYIQQLLGHQCLTTTQTYTDITKEDLRDVVERAHPASGRDR